MIGPAVNNPECDAQIREGDRLRDTRQYAAAAEAYAAALAIAPQRTDIRIQYGNMLKDSGRPAEAETAYRHALAATPDDPDIHLQLGRALKLRGKRNEAVAAYRRAATLRPDNIDALRELFFAGSFDDQQQLFERRLATGGIEAIMALGEEIARLQAKLQRIAEKLPDLRAQTAVPLAGYDRFRRLYDIPPAPAPLRSCRFALIVPTRGAAFDTLYAQLAAIRMQTIAEWQLCVERSADRVERSGIRRRSGGCRMPDRAIARRGLAGLSTRGSAAAPPCARMVRVRRDPWRRDRLYHRCRNHRF